jgi:hypothetical protein
MSVGFYITFIGLLTRRYIEQTPYRHSIKQTKSRYFYRVGGVYIISLQVRQSPEYFSIDQPESTVDYCTINQKGYRLFLYTVDIQNLYISDKIRVVFL